MSQSLVTQADLEAMFTAERVAEVFSVQDGDGVDSGSADAIVLAIAIRMGSGEAIRGLIGVHPTWVTSLDATTCPDTLKQLVGVFVMHQGMMRRPACQVDAKKSPYYSSWEQARRDLKDLRDGYQRLSEIEAPANVGGQIAHSLPVAQRPFIFVGNPATGEGGFNSGDF